MGSDHATVRHIGIGPFQYVDTQLGKSKLQLSSPSGPESNEGYDRYMRGLYALEHRGQSGKLEEAIDLFKETIELDPQRMPYSDSSIKNREIGHWRSRRI